MSDLKQTIEQNLDKWEAVLKAFPKGQMGLTPDSVKAMPEFKEAKQQFNYWFEQLRAYNKSFFKTHKCIRYENVNGKRVAIYKTKNVK